MKRFISLLSVIILISTALFAADEYDDGDIYDDGYDYEQNGTGDQFLKIDLAANFPLNFGDKLYIGIGASAGYYYFINRYFAVGGDAIIGWNNTIGEKPLVTVPVTFGVMAQPYIGKFEFPFMLNIGFASISCQNLTYFPSLALKGTAGIFYRFSETWSFGISSTTYWIPMWVAGKPEKNDNGLFTNLGLSLRYHF